MDKDDPLRELDSKVTVDMVNYQVNEGSAYKKNGFNARMPRCFDRIPSLPVRYSGNPVKVHLNIYRVLYLNYYKKF